MNDLAKELAKRIASAKKAVFPNRSLYEVYGQIKMARELNVVSEEDFLQLNHECVCEGINNPKYFDRV